MKRKPIKKVSDNKRFENSIKDILRAILKKERGDRCEICERAVEGIHLFHILREGRYPRLRFHSHNLLLACWRKCHYPFHHLPAHDPRSKEIEDKIKQLRGENYREELLIINKMQPQHNMTYLKTLKMALKKQLEDTK